MPKDRKEPDQRRSAGVPADRTGPALYQAVLFDRDGTLVEDVPYNGDPARVRAVPGARAALDRLRAAGLRLGVVSNQSGLARGYFSTGDLARVNTRIEELVGPFDTWQICPHDEGEGCGCRKPAPGLVRAAARTLGVAPDRCVVVGDIGRDLVAAGAAGAAGLLVPTPVTDPREVAAAGWVAPDLPSAVSQILDRQRAVTATRPRTAGTVLVVRSDSAGDVLVTGPAIRAVAAHARRVVLLCGPRGRAAADLLPGVDEVLEHPLPWIDPDPAPVRPAGMTALVQRLAGIGATEAVIFTSYHQSPLPLALLLRMAGIDRVSAISEDYPGSLLDLRHRVPVGVPEPERALSLAAAAGFCLPEGDRPTLRIRPPGPAPLPGGPYLVLHPGSAVDSRACPEQLATRAVRLLTRAGYRVVVTGGAGERELTARVAGADGVDLGGRTDLAGLAAVIARAGALIVGNTGPAHLAAALGVPVVSLFAPTVPYGQWGPWRVPAVRLGDPTAACRDTRAARCPVPGHPCLTGIDPAEVLAAVRLLGVPVPGPRPDPVPAAVGVRPGPVPLGGGSGR